MKINNKNISSDIINEIKNNYIKINIELEKQHQKLRELSQDLRELLDNTSDIDKRKEIIDFVFLDGVEEVQEYAFRKIYLK